MWWSVKSGAGGEVAQGARHRPRTRAARWPGGPAASGAPRTLHGASPRPAGTRLSRGGQRRQLDRIQALRRGILERLALLEGREAGWGGGAGAHGDTAGFRSGLLAHLAALDAAETRLLDGRYGRCEGCGGWIPRRRLELEPAVTRCALCTTRRASGAATPELRT